MNYLFTILILAFALSAGAEDKVQALQNLQNYWNTSSGKPYGGLSEGQLQQWQQQKYQEQQLDIMRRQQRNTEQQQANDWNQQNSMDVIGW